MKIEYVLFNLVVLIGPLMFSFENNIKFVKKYPQAFLSISIIMIPFILWDSLVTNRHWWFNQQFTLDYQILNLPIGEWLFFISIPFASLFVWEVISFHSKNKLYRRSWFFQYVLIIAFIPAIILFVKGKEYTALVLLSISLVALLDKLLNINILQQKRTYIYLVCITIFTLIFNGYLTARPVVLYDANYQLDVRIFTIPVEDFGYGFSLILFNTILYEKFKGKSSA